MLCWQILWIILTKVNSNGWKGQSAWYGVGKFPITGNQCWYTTYILLKVQYDSHFGKRNDKENTRDAPRVIQTFPVLSTAEDYSETNWFSHAVAEEKDVIPNRIPNRIQTRRWMLFVRTLSAVKKHGTTTCDGAICCSCFCPLKVGKPYGLFFRVGIKVHTVWRVHEWVLL